MPKGRITRQGQMENSFLEHNFHILCLIFIGLGYVHNKQTMCCKYIPSLYDQGHGYGPRSNGKFDGENVYGTLLPNPLLDFHISWQKFPP